jgi:hypothetical protein
MINASAAGRGGTRSAHLPTQLRDTSVIAISFYNLLKYLTNSTVVCLRPRNGCVTDRNLIRSAFKRLSVNL